MAARTKSYLGDGVYSEFDGFGIWLTTEDGIRTTNRIYLEPQVVEALKSVSRKLERKRPAKHES